MENNKVQLIGKVVSGFEFSHSSYNEDFYTTKLEILRTSGTSDEVVLMVSQKLIEYYGELTNCIVGVSGTIRTYNDNSHVKMFVFVDSLDVLDLDEIACGENIVELTGYICKKSPIRTTPLGRVISDIVVAVNRNYSKSDYPVCISWGRNAKYIDKLDIGTPIKIEGRIQSRKYTKNEEEHTAYEISVCSVNLNV